MTGTRLSHAAVAVLLAGAATAAAAGIFDDPKNLKVLPKDISPMELGRTMRGFALDLGLRCENCHVGEAGQPLETFDFPADDKDMKATARLMLEMVRDLNERQLAKLARDDGERVAVSCATCHRGQPRPLLMADVLGHAHHDGGVPAAVARYRDLKAAYFGSHSYDFTERPRLEFAQRLAARGAAADGIAFLAQMRDEHGDSYQTDLALADLQAASGDLAAAAAAVEAALARAPEPMHRFLRQRLEALQQR